MKKLLLLLLPVLFVSCKTEHGGRVLTVSIAPYKYFVEAIAGSDFTVNVMVPPGSDPHIYEPVPGQITALRNSSGYISNGYLGFEMAWLDRFYEVNGKMRKLNLGESIVPIESGHEGHSHEGGSHAEGADPHYWVSPGCALEMAADIRDFLAELNPEKADTYRKNHSVLVERIGELDRKANEYFSGFRGRSFMIYHPNLAYIARDYGLNEISVETEGKEPSPSGMKELIDRATRDSIKVIFIQKEYDKRNASVIAGQTGARLVTIDPLSPDWYSSTLEIIEALHKSLSKR